MSLSPPLPLQDFATCRDNFKKSVSSNPPENDQAFHESSEDEGPLIARHQICDSPKERKEGPVLRERRSVRNSGDVSIGCTLNHPALGQSSKSSPTSPQRHKKPGPRPWAAKPIMKNDIQAKKRVIREIEIYWGKGFIRSFIPKCHRPLVKRGKRGKRAVYRNHETDPKNWLPSVLKAILMIAKLTNDKDWLKKAMNDVVRYRIKHTGNRKPQLVTTDFDVIEDMLVKQWSIPYAFEIRYKHLLVNRKDQEENDEDIDHILQVGPDHETESDEEATPDEERLINGENDHDVLEDDEILEGGSIPDEHLQSAGYIEGMPQPPRSSPRQQSKGQKSRKNTKQHREQSHQPQLEQSQRFYDPRGHMTGYNTPISPWGHSLLGFGVPGPYLGEYGSYGAYSDPKGSKGTRQSPQQPIIRGGPHYLHPYHAMTPGPGKPDAKYDARRCPPLGMNTPDLSRYEQTPDLGMSGHFGSHHEGRTKIKRESSLTDEQSLSVNEFDSATNNVIDMVDDGDHDNSDDDDEKAAIDAELKALELELKLARLKARQAALRKQKKTRL